MLLRSLMLVDKIGTGAGSTVSNLVVGHQGVKSLEYDPSMPDVVMASMRIQGTPGESVVLFPLSFVKFGIVATEAPTAMPEKEPEPAQISEPVPEVIQDAPVSQETPTEAPEATKRKPGRPRKS